MGTGRFRYAPPRPKRKADVGFLAANREAIEAWVRREAPRSSRDAGSSACGISAPPRSSAAKALSNVSRPDPSSPLAATPSDRTERKPLNSLEERRRP